MEEARGQIRMVGILALLVYRMLAQDVGYLLVVALYYISVGRYLCCCVCQEDRVKLDVRKLQIDFFGKFAQFPYITASFG